MDWTAASPLRIALLDDHAVVRHGLVELLSEESDFRVIGAFANSREMMAVLRTKPADLLLVDYALAPDDIEGLNLIRALCIRFPESKILVASAHYSPATIALALRAGARGFVGKNQPLTDLVGAIRTVARGRVYLDPELAIEFAYLLSDVAVQDAVAEAASEANEDPLIHHAELSPREREVLRCCLNGMSVTQVAEKFGRSTKTISTQKQSAFRKLGIRTDNELFKMHRQLGML
ncbi:MAG: response regulator transcription factor [Collimonas sp.]|uniref:response regulator transcription factor n=1 Tax=Collimonas sp. TaxID=1963772 RepID=UPI003262CE52